MLEKLQKKFSAELHDTQVAGSNTVRASSMKVEDLAVSVANDPFPLSQGVSTLAWDRERNTHCGYQTLESLGHRA